MGNPTGSSKRFRLSKTHQNLSENHIDFGRHLDKILLSMEKYSKWLTETHQLGGSAHLAVKSSGDDGRGWLAADPECLQLERKHIAHAGVMDAIHPFRVVCLFQSGTFMFACLSGRGEVMVDGRWVKVGANEACLLPPFTANAIRAIRGEPVWKFCWVRYLESRETNPVVSAHSPVFGAYAGEPLRNCIERLRAEAQSEATPATMGLWGEMTHGYVMRFAQPHRRDRRLWKLWKAVDGDPARKWTLYELADAASVSREHLRRICAKELGRSPMQQVTFIRMQKAARMLATTDEKIETICRAVGYSSPHTFSNTFLKWIGRRPSKHQR
jgi:AraC-like DNA-binding protein